MKGRKAGPTGARGQITCFEQDGVSYKVGDTCLFNPADDGAPPYVGTIQSICQKSGSPDDLHLTVLWFYRPEEAYLGRRAFHGDKELFFSDHSDEVHAQCVLRHCTIHSLKHYQALAQVHEDDFYARFTYRIRTRLFEPERVPIYCTCQQPYNPDLPMVLCDACDEWYHLSCTQHSSGPTAAPLLAFRCPACGGAGAGAGAPPCHTNSAATWVSPQGLSRKRPRSVLPTPAAGAAGV